MKPKPEQVEEVNKTWLIGQALRATGVPLVGNLMWIAAEEEQPNEVSLLLKHEPDLAERRAIIGMDMIFAAFGFQCAEVERVEPGEHRRYVKLPKIPERYQNDPTIIGAVQDMLDTLDTSGGLEDLLNGEFRLVADPTWCDLGDSYERLCKALSKKPLIRTKCEECGELEEKGGPGYDIVGFVCEGCGNTEEARNKLLSCRHENATPGYHACPDCATPLPDNDGNFNGE